jgi:hypothetical protein
VVCYSAALLIAGFMHHRVELPLIAILRQAPQVFQHWLQRIQQSGEQSVPRPALASRLIHGAHLPK